jgi:methionine aminotransferase
MTVKSKLPQVGTTIFTLMSAMANEYQAINLSQGFPNYEIDPILKELVCQAVQDGHNQYAPLRGIPTLLEAIAQKIALTFGRSIDPYNELCITSGATEGIFSAIMALIHPGDEVILFEPAYDSYIPSIQLAGGIPKPYRLGLPDYQINWTHVRSMITAKTRMIIINTPNNPTGTILSASDLKELQSIVTDRNIIVLSDEVYEHLVYDKAIHQSVLKYEGLRENAMATFSFGKTFHATGWRMGYIVGPPALMNEFMKVHQFNTFCINRPLQHALASYLQDETRYLSLPSFFQEKRDLFSSLLANSNFELLPCRGSYFMLAKYDKIKDCPDTEMATWMTKEKGVAVIPVSAFYSDNTDERVIRFCFAKTADLLSAAAENLNRI